MQGIAFGPTIRLLRQAKGISLREMARQLGVSPAFLSQIEAGRQHKIPRARIVQVAEMLGVSEGYLLGTAKQVHPDLMKFLSETPEAAEFMVTAMRSGMIAQDYTSLREIVSDKKRRAGVLKPVVAAKKKVGVSHSLDGYLDASLCLAAVAAQNKERLFSASSRRLPRRTKASRPIFSSIA
jgi:transcriptional regulator with XRE-family HTH domain